MNAATTIVSTISEPLTWAAICERYPDQWVCLVEIDRVRPNEFEFRTARVVGHGKTRRDPLEQARLWRQHYRSIGHYSTRKVVADAGLAQDCELRLDVPLRAGEG